MIFGGAGMALFGNFWLLLVAAIIGVLSPSGNEPVLHQRVEDVAHRRGGALDGEEVVCAFGWPAVAHFLHQVVMHDLFDVHQHAAGRTDPPAGGGCTEDAG